VEASFERGDINLIIKDLETNGIIYETRNAETNDSVVLDKGSYSVVISGELYNGYLQILSADEVNGINISSSRGNFS